MGSAAHAAAVPYLERWPKFPTRDNEVLKTKQENSGCNKA